LAKNWVVNAAKEEICPAVDVEEEKCRNAIEVLAITKGHFTIEDAETQEIDVVEMEKWSKTFERLRGLIRSDGG